MKSISDVLSEIKQRAAKAEAESRALAESQRIAREQKIADIKAADKKWIASRALIEAEINDINADLKTSGVIIAFAKEGYGHSKPLDTWTISVNNSPHVTLLDIKAYLNPSIEGKIALIYRRGRSDEEISSREFDTLTISQEQSGALVNEYLNYCALDKLD